MAFFLLCVYWIVLLIRPQDLIYSLNQFPIILYTLILTIIPFFFSKKNAGSPQIVLLVGLLFVIGISATLNGWGGSVKSLVPEFTSAAVVPYVLFSKLIDSTKKHQIIIAITVLITVVMIHNGVSQQLSETGIGWAGSMISQGTRITYLGMLADPNDLGMFLVMNVPFALYCVTRSKGLKLFWIMALLVTLYGIFLTNSRGAFLGIVCVAGLWMLHKHGIKKTVGSLVFLLPIVLVVASKFRTIDAEEESAVGRIEAWYEGFQMLIHHPIFGVGMNRFTEYNDLTAHNSYVLIAAELGLVGYILWISFILLTFTMLFQIAFYNNNFIYNKLAPTETNSFSPEILEEIALAKVSFFSLIGFMVTAFFLSRCYAFVVFIYAGIAISGYYRALVLMPELSPVELGKLVPKFIFLSLVSITCLYFVVRILN